jgi:hypothetical protein
MKKNKIIPFLLAATIIFVGCKKDDGYLPERYLSQIDDVPGVTVKVNATGSQSIDLTNLAAFQGKFDVALYFPNSAPPAKVDIIVRKNASNANVRTFKTDVKTFPVTFTVTAAEIAALFGAPIALGDSYDFGATVYTASGSKFDAFPLGGIGVGSGPSGAPGYSDFARYGAICAYNPSIYQGNFVVQLDGWNDYSVGDVFPVTQVSANQFSFKYLPDSPLPIIITVNTGNNVTSVVKQVYSNTGYPPGWPYGPISVESVAGSADNYVAPCDQVFSIRLNHTVAAGTFGAYTFRAKKQ